MDEIMSREDYIEVSERLQKFYEKYPDGSIQGVWGWLDDTHQVIVYQAQAFRDRDDPRPGVGTASEPYPGLTSFTRNSEIMNAETSAWGRALASLGIAVHRGIASAQEVRAAQRGTDVPKVTRVAATEDDNGWYGPPAEKTPHVDQGPSPAQMQYAIKEPATDKQIKMMMAKMSQLGLIDPATRLQYVNAALIDAGLASVESATGLTKYTAGKVIDALLQAAPP